MVYVNKARPFALLAKRCNAVTHCARLDAVQLLPAYRAAKPYRTAYILYAHIFIHLAFLAHVWRTFGAQFHTQQKARANIANKNRRFSVFR